MPRLRQRCRAEVRATRHPYQQCRHPQIREGRGGERGELERDPQRQPDDYVFCAKAAVPLMRRNKGGAIVNVASVRSVVAGGGNLQYDTTKAAVAGLTRALAADHSPD